MPIWPFNTRRTDGEPDDALPPVLQRVEAGTPWRFRLRLTDEGQVDAAVELLRARLGSELDLAIAEAAGERSVVEVTSTFAPGSAAVQRPLNVLQRAGIGVSHTEILDLVSLLDESALRRVVEAWGEFANQGPHRLRVERLAGMDLLERCLVELVRAGEAGPGRRAAWSFAMTCITLNTPGAESRVIAEATRTRDPRQAESFVSAAQARIRLAGLGGLDVDVPPEGVAELVGRPGYLGELACRLAGTLPEPIPDSVREALQAVAGESGERAVAALAALAHAEPTPDLRAAIDAALDADDANVRAAALETLAHLWGADARPAWREFLASKMAPMRWAAETVIGLHGTEEDLAQAVAHLATLARSKAAVPQLPPRGNEIVDLLVRHRDHPTARAGLDDLSARWDRLPEGLRGWLAEHHPWLDPAGRSDQPSASAAEPEEELSWPPPAIERRGDLITLEFDEAAAHHPVRERFEELAMAHPAVDVLDGDREWLTVRVGAVDAEHLIHQLWAAAGAGANPEG